MFCSAAPRTLSHRNLSYIDEFLRTMLHKSISNMVRFSTDKMVKINLFENENFFCDVYCLSAGQGQKLHSHASEDKIYYVLDGSATVTIDEETRSFEAGHAVLAPRGTSHGLTTSTQATVLVFMAPHPNWKPSGG